MLRVFTNGVKIDKIIIRSPNSISHTYIHFYKKIKYVTIYNEMTCPCSSEKYVFPIFLLIWNYLKVFPAPLCLSTLSHISLPFAPRATYMVFLLFRIPLSYKNETAMEDGFSYSIANKLTYAWYLLKKTRRVSSNNRLCTLCVASHF